MRAARVQPVDHFFQQVAPDLRDARSGVEIGEMSLRESEIAVKAVNQNFECVLKRMKIALPRRIVRRRAHVCFRFESESAQVTQQMPENLESISRGKAIELQHDRRIKRRHVAMPDVARDTGEEDVGVTTLERAHHRHLRNGMTLPEIFTQKKRVDPRSVAAHDHVLIIVGENLRLDEITRAEKLGDGARFAYGAKRTLPKLFIILDVGTLQFLPGERRKLFAIAKTEMPRHIDTLEAR